MTTTTQAPGARIPLASIEASKTNPRKHFDQAALAELADSIKRHDILQPVLVRFNGAAGKYELVAGERRFRAAKAAGLTDIPATIRELTDAEVLEIQVVENLQRKDLHELEEAEGYEKLLKCTHPSGERYTVDEIAAKVGKSRSYVFARLKLCSLCPEARKAFYAGELDASRALLIARIGHHDTQRQALKDVTRGRYGNGEAMSYREAHQHILQNYMLALKSAPFDITDAGLNTKAGACGPCPKRTGNQADLFGDVKSADVCTDPKCFDDKRQAHYRTDVVSLEAQGFKVIAGDAAKKVLPGWDHHRAGENYFNVSGGYEKFDGETYLNGRRRPVRSLFGKDFKPTKLQHPLTGEIFDVVTQQAIAAAAKKLPEAKKGKSGGASRQHREPEKTPEMVFRERLFVETLRKLPATPGKTELRIAAKDVIEAIEELGLVADVLVPREDGKPHDGASGRKALEAAAEKSITPELLAWLAVASSASMDVGYTYGRLKALPELAKACRVDPAKVKAQIAVEEKAKAEAAAQAKASAKKKPAKKKGLGRAMPPVVEPKKLPGKAAKKRRPAVADFMKPKTPSAELAVIVGANAMPRTEITSKLWGYIKKHGLQDKTNRRMINTDEKLRPILGGKKQVSMFEMTKYIVKQLS